MDASLEQLLLHLQEAPVRRHLGQEGYVRRHVATDESGTEHDVATHHTEAGVAEVHPSGELRDTHPRTMVPKVKAVLVRPHHCALRVDDQRPWEGKHDARIRIQRGEAA